MESIASLKKLVHFSPNTGEFRWKDRKDIRPCVNSRIRGKIAGTISISGYVVISINGKFYYGHRLAWLFCTGEWPKGEVDHVNGVRSDNRFKNLREATRSQNAFNKKKRFNERPKGITQLPSGKWRAQIAANRVFHHLGCFDSMDEAHSAYRAAAKILHGEFAKFD